MRYLAGLLSVGVLALFLSGVIFSSASFPTVRAEDDHSDFITSAFALQIGGGPVNGSIEEKPVVDNDFFKFDAQRGAKYTFTLDLVSIRDAEIHVIESNLRGAAAAEGQRVTLGDRTKQVQWVAPSTDTYFLVVAGARDTATEAFILGHYVLTASADYSLNDQYGETIAEATPLLVGSQYPGAISPWPVQSASVDRVEEDYDHDYFSWEATRGVEYRITAQPDGLDGLGISVENGSGEVVAANEGFTPTLAWIAPSTGTYYLGLSGSDLVRDPVGAYVLEVTGDLALEDIRGSSRSDAYNLNNDDGSIGGPVDGAISPADDTDYFSIQASRGVRYVFDVETAAGLEAQISVEDADGTTRATNQGVGSSLDWIARTDGPHYVVVAASPLERSPVSAYLLGVAADQTLEDRHEDGQPGATRVQFGETHTGSISPAADRDFFYFQADKGASYDFRIGPDALDSVSMSLVGPLGHNVATLSGPGASLEWTAPKSMTYFLALTAAPTRNSGVGHYDFHAAADVSLVDQHSDQRSNATRLAMDVLHHGAINPDGDRDYFTFTAKRGAVYDITVDSDSAAGLNIAVASANGQVAVSNLRQGNRLVWAAPTSEVYYVIVSNPGLPGNPVGPYTLLVAADASYEDQPNESLASAAPIALSTIYAGAVSPRDDRDIFKFEAKRGIVYSVDAGRGALVDIVILRPDGTPVARNHNQSPFLDWAAPDNGEYFAAVSAPIDQNAPLRTYVLEIIGVEVTEDRHGDSVIEATPLRMGSRITGAISPTSDLDRLYFQAAEGVLYTFELTYGTASRVSLTVSSSAAPEAIVASNYGQDASVKWLSPDNEEYVVTLSRAPQLPDPVGTYYLRATSDSSLIDRHASDLTGATTLELDQAVTGGVSPAEDTDVFVFDGELGSTYLVRVRSVAGQTARFTVTNPESSFSANNHGAADTVLATAPEKGQYYVVVSAGLGSPGDYTKYEITVTLDQFSPIIDTSVSSSDSSTAAGQGNADAPGISLEAGSRVVSPGGLVRVPIALSSAVDLAGLAGSLLYDPEAVELVGVGPGSLLASAEFNYTAQEPGIVRFGFTWNEPIRGAGSAAVVVFRAIGGLDASSPLQLTLGLAADSAGRPLPMTLSGGELLVGPRVAGDGNGDGMVSALDALIALKMANGTTEVDLALDLDGDGRVTRADAQKILALAGLGREA